MEHPCIPKDISPYLPQLLWNLGCIPPPSAGAQPWGRALPRSDLTPASCLLE